MEASLELHRAWVPAVTADRSTRFAAQLAEHESGASWKGIALAEDGRIAAWVNLNGIQRGVSQCANAGWSVSAPFAGQGMMVEAVTALLDVAFAKDGVALHRVAAGIMPENTRSLRVAAACGFREEGFAPELVCIAGQWRDHRLFAKLAREHRPPG